MGRVLQVPVAPGPASGIHALPSPWILETEQDDLQEGSIPWPVSIEACIVTMLPTNPATTATPSYASESLDETSRPTKFSKM
jgi:hypothetical protein